MTNDSRTITLPSRHGAVQTAATFTAGNPEVLFEGNYYFGLRGRNYDIAQDGQRFLMIEEGGGSEETAASAQIIVAQNWFEALKRLVPTE